MAVVLFKRCQQFIIDTSHYNTSGSFNQFNNNMCLFSCQVFSFVKSDAYVVKNEFCCRINGPSANIVVLSDV